MRILQETPPSGILYYKYKPKSEDDNGEAQKDQPDEMLPQKKRHHPILETDEKTKIKIRFSDLPLSRCS